MMEFATENYLSDLLINTESNGFESAKESFYECIANDKASLESAGDVALAVVGGIIALPLFAVAAVVAIAVIAIGAVLSLVYAILKFIISIPIWIAKLIKDKATKSKINKMQDKIKTALETESAKFYEKFGEYGNASKKALASLKPYINSMNNIDVANKDKADFDSNDINLVEKIKTDLDQRSKTFDEAKASFDETFDKIASEFKEKPDGKYYGALVSDAGWERIANTCKAMTPDIKEYQKALQNYQEKLKKTDEACKKAKAAGEKEVKLNSQAALATENSNKILKSANAIVKLAADWVKMSSTLVNSAKSIDSTLVSDDKANTIQNSTKEINDNERDLEFERVGKAMSNNIKEWASKQPHLQPKTK